jgi:hypothetical protein
LLEFDILGCIIFTSTFIYWTILSLEGAGLPNFLSSSFAITINKTGTITTMQTISAIIPPLKVAYSKESAGKVEFVITWVPY